MNELFELVKEGFASHDVKVIAAAVAGLLALVAALKRARVQVQKARSAALARGLLAQAVPTELVPPPERAMYAELEAGLRGALERLSGSRLGGGGEKALYALPFQVMMGPSGAGKTTLIRGSGLDFLQGSEKIEATPGIGGTRDCNWWFTNHGIILDTAGRYTSEEEDHAEWLTFLRLLRRYRSEKPIDGVIIAVGVDSLMSEAHDSGAAAGIASDLRRRVDELCQELDVIPPVYLLVTKCDLLPGFRESFAEMNEREREQIWGFTLPLRPEGPVAEEATPIGLEPREGRIWREFIGLNAFCPPVGSEEAAAPCEELRAAWAKLAELPITPESGDDNGAAQVIREGQREMQRILGGIDPRWQPWLVRVTGGMSDQVEMCVANNALCVLDRAWAEQLVAPWEEGISHKYPFARHALVDAAPEAVGGLLGASEGALWRFYEERLSAVVPRDGAGGFRRGGRVGAVDSSALAGSLVRTLADAATVGRALVEEGSVEVSINPVEHPDFFVERTTLRAGEQTCLFTNAKHRPQRLSWPLVGADGVRISVAGRRTRASLAATGASGELMDQTLYYPGPWGLLRLIDDSRVEVLAGGERLVLTKTLHDLLGAKVVIELSLNPAAAALVREGRRGDPLAKVRGLEPPAGAALGGVILRSSGRRGVDALMDAVIGVFGKHRARRDFVRWGGMGALSAGLEAWIGAEMARSVGRVEAPPGAAIRFALKRRGGRRLLMGTWIWSCDAIGRRYPLIGYAEIEAPAVAALELMPMVTATFAAQMESILSDVSPEGIAAALLEVAAPCVDEWEVAAARLGRYVRGLTARGWGERVFGGYAAWMPSVIDAAGQLAEAARRGGGRPVSARFVGADLRDLAIWMGVFGSSPEWPAWLALWTASGELGVLGLGEPQVDLIAALWPAVGVRLRAWRFEPAYAGALGGGAGGGSEGAGLEEVLARVRDRGRSAKW
jgi:type VI secretion system ImpM family protein